MARGGSLLGGGGRTAWWAGLGGGGAGPLVGVCPAGEGAGRLFRELCRCGRSGGGGARELGAGFPPEVGGRGLEAEGGVGGRGFSLL